MRLHTATGMVLTVGLVLSACSNDDSESTASRQSSDEAAVRSASEYTPENETGPLLDGGAASCVESYSLETLQNRDFAFDGTVVRMGPSVSDRGDDGDLNLAGITFEVREWFMGGDANEVTVDVQGAAGTAEEDLPFRVGTRLLMSGEPRWGGAPLDSPIAWGCGFSRYYDEETATAWRESTTP